MGNMLDYVKCQRFIVLSELKYQDSDMGINLSQSNFIDKAIECIFDSLEKIAEEIDKLSPKPDKT
jgi:hypothetical protein